MMGVHFEVSQQGNDPNIDILITKIFSLISKIFSYFLLFISNNYYLLSFILVSISYLFVINKISLVKMKLFLLGFFFLRTFLSFIVISSGASLDNFLVFSRHSLSYLFFDILMVSYLIKSIVDYISMLKFFKILLIILVISSIFLSWNILSKELFGSKFIKFLRSARPKNTNIDQYDLFLSLNFSDGYYYFDSNFEKMTGSIYLIHLLVG